MEVSKKEVSFVSKTEKLGEMLQDSSSGQIEAAELINIAVNYHEVLFITTTKIINRVITLCYVNCLLYDYIYM